MQIGDMVVTVQQIYNVGIIQEIAFVKPTVGVVIANERYNHLLIAILKDGDSLSREGSHWYIHKRRLKLMNVAIALDMMCDE